MRHGLLFKSSGDLYLSEYRDKKMMDARIIEDKGNIYKNLRPFQMTFVTIEEGENKQIGIKEIVTINVDHDINELFMAIDLLSDPEDREALADNVEGLIEVYEHNRRKL